MTMLSQVAVALAFELGLHKDIAVRSGVTQGASGSGDIRTGIPKPPTRSMEDRRTFLALFHLTSA